MVVPPCTVMEPPCPSSLPPSLQAKAPDTVRSPSPSSVPLVSVEAADGSVGIEGDGCDERVDDDVVGGARHGAAAPIIGGGPHAVAPHPRTVGGEGGV